MLAGQVAVEICRQRMFITQRRHRQVGIPDRAVADIDAPHPVEFLAQRHVYLPGEVQLFFTGTVALDTGAGYQQRPLGFHVPVQEGPAPLVDQGIIIQLAGGLDQGTPIGCTQRPHQVQVAVHHEVPQPGGTQDHRNGKAGYQKQYHPVLADL